MTSRVWHLKRIRETDRTWVVNAFDVHLLEANLEVWLILLHNCATQKQQQRQDSCLLGQLDLTRALTLFLSLWAHDLGHLGEIAENGRRSSVSFHVRPS